MNILNLVVFCGCVFTLTLIVSLMVVAWVRNHVNFVPMDADSAADQAIEILKDLK